MRLAGAFLLGYLAGIWVTIAAARRRMAEYEAAHPAREGWRISFEGTGVPPTTGTFYPDPPELQADDLPPFDPHLWRERMA